MKRSLCLLFALTLLATGCGESKAQTNSFVNKPDVTALLGLPDGGLRYATVNGEIFDADNDGRGPDKPITTVVGMNEKGVLGLVGDQQQRTFASWVDKGSDLLTIAQVFPGPTRVIYRGVDKSSDKPGGRLTLTAENRIYTTFTKTGGSGQILSIDPDRNADQVANVISGGGWNQPAGLAFAAGHVLWAIDAGNGSSADRLTRVQPNGPIADTESGISNDPVALSHYGDTELVVCFAKTGDLRRYMINDGIRALPGRQLANDCASDVTQLHDGRLAYATKTEVRVTAL